MNAIKEINRINQRELELGLAAKGSWHDEYKDSAYIFVGGLAYELTEGDVITIFSQWGEIVDINMPRDKTTGKTKGFGFVMYEDQRSTVLAVDNMNGAQVLGRTIRVDHCRKYNQPGQKSKEGEHVAPEEPTYNAMPPTIEGNTHVLLKPTTGSDDSDSDDTEEEKDDLDDEDPMAAFLRAEKKKEKMKSIKEGKKKRKHEGESKEERRARKEAKRAKRAEKEMKKRVKEERRDGSAQHRVDERRRDDRDREYRSGREERHDTEGRAHESRSGRSEEDEPRARGESVDRRLDRNGVRDRNDDFDREPSRMDRSGRWDGNRDDRPPRRLEDSPREDDRRNRTDDSIQRNGGYSRDGLDRDYREIARSREERRGEANGRRDDYNERSRNDREYSDRSRGRNDEYDHRRDYSERDYRDRDRDCR